MDQTRPLALWGLVSTSIFSDRPTPDFYLGLIPFFEPFIEDNDGKLLDIAALKTYAETKLLFQLNDDVADLFVARMEQVGWVQIIADDADSRVYRCKFSGTSNQRNYADAEGHLAKLVDRFRGFTADADARLDLDSTEEIEEHFLRFLSRQSSFESRELEALEPSNIQAGQIEYWIAKFIGWLSHHDPETFEFVQRISGISLLTDALLELRNPSDSIAEAKSLVVYLDGPLLMNHLGLSGKRAKENTTYIIEKLRQAGATIACFRHSCDEIKDNLVGVLARPPHERTGPTAEAIRDRSVTEAFVANVKNNVEHFVKSLGHVQILPQKVSQFRSADKYCDDTLRLRLCSKMPAQTNIARERDADSITIIMRRRQGLETSDFCASKFVLITSNGQLVRRANELLREYRALGTDKALVGPAMQDRIVGGILFANFGLAEKKDISRTQLLATCARVIMLRPKILERMRQQIAALNRPEDAALVDAMLSQPRASEIVMDYTIGKSRSVSASNIEELISAVKRVSADEVRRDYELRMERARAEAERHLEEKTQALILQFERERDNLLRRHQDSVAERGTISAKLAALESQLSNLANEQTARDQLRKQDLQRTLASAKLAAEAAMKRVKRHERASLMAGFLALCAVFIVPLFFSGPLSWIIAATGGILSAFAMIYFIWNKTVSHVYHFFEHRAFEAVSKELERLQMDYLQRYMHLEYKTCTVTLLLEEAPP
jgi:hypothetical protein